MSEVIWGINPVLEALKSRPEKIEEIIISKSHLRGKVYQIVEQAKKLGLPLKIQAKFHPAKIPREAQTQGVVAYLSEYRYADLAELKSRWEKAQEAALVVAADGITDPQNLGALIRSAEAAGAHGLIVPKRRSAGITGVVAKASAGALIHLPVARVPNLVRALSWLKDQGLWIVGLAGEAQTTIYELDLTLPVALVIGSEGKGLRELVRKNCDYLASIPMKGRVDSLNAAVAGAVALFEVVRQRYFKLKEPTK